MVLPITVARAVDLTGKAWKTIKKVIVEQQIRPIGRERNADLYDSEALLRAVYGTQEPEDLDLSEERARLAKEQADRVAMENAVRRKELAPIAVVTTTLARVSSQVAAHLEAVPGKVRMRLPHLTNADLDVIQHEIVAARNLAAAVNIESQESDGPERYQKSRRSRS